jgi:hypothetical protein
MRPSWNTERTSWLFATIARSRVLKRAARSGTVLKPGVIGKGFSSKGPRIIEERVGRFIGHVDCQRLHSYLGRGDM